MRILIQYGADVNEAIPDGHGLKRMHFAASKDQIKAVIYWSTLGRIVIQ